MTGDRNADDLYGSRVREIDGAPQPVSPCPVCRATTARARFAVEGVEPPVVICEKCGLGRFHPMLGPDAIAALYPDAYYGEPGAKFHPLRGAGGALDRLAPRALPLARARAGLARARRRLRPRRGARRARQPAASKCTASRCRRRPRAAPTRVRRSASRSDLAAAGYPSSYFDQVLIWHVLEHLEQPRETLEEVRRILRPGGRLVVAVPNLASRQAAWSGAAWFHLDLPRHLYHFPLAALRRLLDETGFEPVSDHHFSLRQNPFGWIQSALNRVALAAAQRALHTAAPPRPRAPRAVRPAHARDPAWRVRAARALGARRIGVGRLPPHRRDRARRRAAPPVCVTRSAATSNPAPMKSLG